MSTVYAVSTLPVRDTNGAIRGWVRSDPLADGSKPTDTVILRDGSAWAQKDAMAVINRDPSLLYDPPEADAAAPAALGALDEAA